MSTLNRHKPLGRNSKRSREMKKRNYPHGDAIRAMPCTVAKYHFEDQAGPSAHIRALVQSGHIPSSLSCLGAIESAHVLGARGMGGSNTEPDADDQIPLCHWHAVQAGELGTSERAAFENLYNIDTQVEAVLVGAEVSS